MDQEKNLLLRKLRNMLGYGLGWSFIGALKEWLYPKLAVISIFLLFIYLAYHMDIQVVWK